MHSEDIKAAIRKTGVSQSDIARQLKVSPQVVSDVIRGSSRSERVASAIAAVIGLSIHEVWPNQYSHASRAEKLARLAKVIAKAAIPPKSTRASSAKSSPKPRRHASATGA